ncbi:hypothetical protein PR048_007699 [Dryococelus australis]|uniref:Uncharacterized protein n=1 Tax=Dryococelus australis TaxID=614101 RepID=A0ABQ9HUZ7_9NEOP|nr:hypothetical protein PR048_007699 [Dryococelus australis]
MKFGGVGTATKCNSGEKTGVTSQPGIEPDSSMCNTICMHAAASSSPDDVVSLHSMIEKNMDSGFVAWPPFHITGALPPHRGGGSVPGEGPWPPSRLSVKLWREGDENPLPPPRPSNFKFAAWHTKPQVSQGSAWDLFPNHVVSRRRQLPGALVASPSPRSPGSRSSAPQKCHSGRGGEGDLRDLQLVTLEAGQRRERPHRLDPNENLYRQFTITVFNMEQRRNTRAGETGEPRENPSTSGIVRHKYHIEKSGSDPAGNQTRFSLAVGGAKPPAIRQSGYDMEVDGKEEGTGNIRARHCLQRVEAANTAPKKLDEKFLVDEHVSWVDERQCSGQPCCTRRRTKLYRASNSVT